MFKQVLLDVTTSCATGNCWCALLTCGRMPGSNKITPGAVEVPMLWAYHCEWRQHHVPAPGRAGPTTGETQDRQHTRRPWFFTGNTSRAFAAGALPCCITCRTGTCKVQCGCRHSAAQKSVLEIQPISRPGVCQSRQWRLWQLLRCRQGCHP